MDVGPATPLVMGHIFNILDVRMFLTATNKWQSSMINVMNVYKSFIGSVKT